MKTLNAKAKPLRRDKRRQYSKPALSEFGRVHDLTKALGTGGMNDVAMTNLKT